MDSTKTKLPLVRLLLLQSSTNNLLPLRDSLMASGDGQLSVDCLNVEDLHNLPQEKYDLVVGWNDVKQQLSSGPEAQPLRFMPIDDPVCGPVPQAAIQSSLCNLVRGCDPSARCLALSTSAAIANFQSEQQCRSTEQRLRKLRRTVDQSPDPVMITDYSGVLEYVNPAFEALTGYSREEVIGQTLGILKSEQQSGELYEEMWDAVLSGKAFYGTVMNRKKNGETFILQKSITPLRNAEGAITHFISTGRDITDQRKLEGQLQQAQRMDAIGRLAGGVAHDFNNLLMVISAYAELMNDSLPPQDPLRHNVSEIVNASRRAADLTRQLLAFGRKQMQALQVLDLNKVIAEINRMLPRLIGEDIQLSFIAGEELGKVRADPTQIEQVVMNLAANARDAMPSGGKLTIETRNVLLDETYAQERPMVPPGEYVQLTVTDSGSGIPKEHVAHIFEPFFTTKEDGKGTGLGLATVYGIVKQSEGFIWVYSEPGLGTTFKVYLPRIDGAAKEINSKPVNLPALSGTETVLLVEDEAAVRLSTREFLIRHGYTVLEAQNGEEALRVSRSYCGPIHVLISDVVMPRMSGPAVAEQLAAERPQMMLLFVSGYAEKTVLQHGPVDFTTQFLQKPFCFNELGVKIRDLLASGQAHAHAAAGSSQ